MMDGSENSADASVLGEMFLAKDGTQCILQTQEMDENLDDMDRDNDQPLREQDRFLPIANVARIMKNGIPKTGKVAKDAKECAQECVSEFISFITSEASERCHQEKRKTINGEDILFAMSTLGFDNYVEPLKVYLQKYRETCGHFRQMVVMTADTTKTISWATKGDKVLAAGDAALEELGPDDSFTSTLGGNILGVGEQMAHSNVMYTAYPTQITTNQISFG